MPKKTIKLNDFGYGNIVEYEYDSVESNVNI